MLDDIQYTLLTKGIKRYVRKVDLNSAKNNIYIYFFKYSKIKMDKSRTFHFPDNLFSYSISMYCILKMKYFPYNP